MTNCQPQPHTPKSPRVGQRGQAMSDWLVWAALMTVLASITFAVAMPVVRKVPAALAGWTASVAP